MTYLDLELSLEMLAYFYQLSILHYFSIHNSLQSTLEKVGTNLRQKMITNS